MIHMSKLNQNKGLPILKSSTSGKNQTWRKKERKYMFCHNTSQASNNMQLGNVTAADEGCLKVVVKGMIL